MKNNKKNAGIRGGLIEEQENKLAALERKSADALDVVTSTIKNLDGINSEIEEIMYAINEQRAKLESTYGQLRERKEKNGKIINKFKNLIED